MDKEKSFNKSSEWGESHYWHWSNFFCHWRILGKENKEPLVFVHGFGASSSHWRFNAEYFANKGFRVYALDLIGFGKSEQPGKNKIEKLDNRFWSFQVSSFLKEIVKITDKEQAILIGNSLGGLVAVTTLAFYPNLVKSVIAAPLPDPALMKTKKLHLPRFLKKVKNILIRIFFNLLPLEIIIPIIIKTKALTIALQLAYSSSVKNDLELKEIILKPAKRKTASRALRLMCIGMSCRKEANTAPRLLSRIHKMQIDIPVLLIWGREDKLVPLSIGKALSSKYSWLKLLIIENTGHCPHDDSPCDFNHYVLHWLENNSGGHIQKI